MVDQLSKCSSGGATSAHQKNSFILNWETVVILYVSNQPYAVGVLSAQSSGIVQI